MGVGTLLARKHHELKDKLFFLMMSFPDVSILKADVLLSMSYAFEEELKLASFSSATAMFGRF